MTAQIDRESEQYKRAEYMTRDLPTMLTASEVCDFFRISRKTLGIWFKENKLPGTMRIGKRDLRIPKDDIIMLSIKMYGEQ
ncbi:hypothetical protein GMA3_57 [Gordonia phage GMA3]|uniref:Helix-turn-helix domain-containing protein n=1 Tax=Gordonia phage GMA3 TaxID=1647284 RepID=A0A0K0NKX0_9CAUD|nr:HTH DNA binding protein [Gordonia phage GMA3]AKL88234.1 hypothetical protein GMA3_57 [Gordonia phage GMA3]